MERLTPMQKQYQAIKKEAPESILFFRLGDFYEMFGDDAVEASEILDIALTSRNKNAENPEPMCGIPARSYERYIAKLTKAGKRVAIADQVSDPSAPGIVERKITKIITPGTTFSEQILDEKKQNFLAAFFAEREKYAIAFADITTGKAFVQVFNSVLDALQEIQKMEVQEVLFTPEQFKQFSEHFSYFQGTISRHFIPENTEKFLINFFQTKNLKAFGIEKNTTAISASALLFSFLEETQKLHISHVSGIHLKNTADSMPLDTDTIKNLELFYSSNGEKSQSLFSFMDETKTPMGGRKLQSAFLAPLQKKEEITARLEKVLETLENPKVLHLFSQSLKSVSDIERICARIATKRAMPKDFVLLKNSLIAIQEISKDLENEDIKAWKKWNEQIGEFF